MNEILKRFLFGKGYLVGGEKSENAFHVRFSLANLFNVSIVEGWEMANEEMIGFVSEMLGERVPAPFYKNFPASVKALSPDALLFDQLLHYARTCEMGDLSEAGEALFETEFERLAFREKADVKKFTILDEEQAVEQIVQAVENLLKGTRPLSDEHYEIVKLCISEYGYIVKSCACKDTAIRLLMDTKDASYAEFLSLSDVIKLVDTVNYTVYNNKNVKKLNLKNQDRKFITAIIHTVFKKGYCNVQECFEKKAIWSGLLHHIHFVALTPKEEKFVALMRGNENRSVYSAFEKALMEEDIKAAVTCLREGKGSAALLRRLNHILSRCKSEEDVAFVVNSLDSSNVIVLIQMLMQYANYAEGKGRSFRFTRYNMLRLHKESKGEQTRRKSILPAETRDILTDKIVEMLSKTLFGRLGKVYISPEMYQIALPLQENTSNGGYGVLPKGSRIHIEKGRKIRAFTYWEKVNDIDLSVIGLTKDGRQLEFSWRTMYNRQNNAIAYSGDQTTGYNGGSEYFDVNPTLVRMRYPDLKYMIFCNNVFSGTTFNSCLCKAGYMLRDVKDSGEVFEPKTVKSSFIVDCDSRFAYLFGIDLEANDFVWLNVSRDSNVNVAGMTTLDFLADYFKSTSIMNVGLLFEMMATESVEDPAEAEVVVSDEEIEVAEGVEVIRSCDFDKIIAAMNA